MKTKSSTMLLAVILLICQRSGAATYNLEIDYMVDSSAGNAHTHKPNQNEIDAVVQMFACQGHTLNVQISSAIPHFDNLIADPAHPNSFFGYNGADNSFGKLRDTWFNHAGQAGWHYCIFCHNYEGTGSSGLAETPGGNLVVAMGSFANQIGTPFDRASSLAHEFGHNLGLTHCGNMDCSSTGTFVPIVPSLMTYFFQLQGVRTNLICLGLTPSDGALFKEMDYSHGAMCAQNEASLNEAFGTGMVPVDWNCDGNVQGVVSHVIRGDESGWCGAAGTTLFLSDYDEWSHLTDVTLGRPADQINDAPISRCITADEARALQRGGCPQPGVVSEPCVVGQMFYVAVGSGGFQNGRCSDPMHSVTTAHAFATPGSRLFLVGGTFNEPGVVNLTTPMTISTVGVSWIKPP